MRAGRERVGLGPSRRGADPAVAAFLAGFKAFPTSRGQLGRQHCQRRSLSREMERRLTSRVGRLTSLRRSVNAFNQAPEARS